MLEPAPRTSFDQLYAKVLAELTEGHLRPADRINIKELALKLRVSTTPLREVLSRLVGRGLVAERRSEGYYLARLDARDIIDLYEFHAVCVIRAARKCPVDRLPSGPADSAWRLFDALAKAAGDVIILDVRRYLNDRLKLIRNAEAILFGLPGIEAAEIAAAIGTADVEALCLAIDRFHDRRCAAASELALVVGRGTDR